VLNSILLLPDEGPWIGGLLECLTLSCGDSNFSKDINELSPRLKYLDKCRETTKEKHDERTFSGTAGVA
jgi:hypothetical protein